MNIVSRDQFDMILKEQRIKPRLARELRFRPEDVLWDDQDMVSVSTRSGSEGLLFIELVSFFIVPYELSRGLADTSTGRSKPITCDFCFTWQQGSKAGRITFVRKRDGHTFTYLCCADLRCSLHVRDLTPEAILSRTQLREDNDIARRTIRMRGKLEKILSTIAAQPTRSASDI